MFIYKYMLINYLELITIIIEVFTSLVCFILFTHHSERPYYVKEMYLHLCTERSEVSVTVCVIVL